MIEFRICECVFNILLSTVALRRESLLVTSISRHEIIWVRDSKRCEWHTDHSFILCSYISWALLSDSSEGQTWKGREFFPSPPLREWLWGHLDFIIRGTEDTILEDKGDGSLKLTTHLLRGRLQGVVNRNSSFTYILYLQATSSVMCQCNARFKKESLLN